MPASDLPDHPRAHHVARAIVEAARATSEDPIGVAQGVQPSRARAYACYALRRLFPKVALARIGEWVGCANRKSAENLIARAPQRPWWQSEVADAIVVAIKEQIEPAAASEQPAALVAPRPRPASQEIWGGRIAPKPAVVITKEILGDPAPERSALAERQRSVIALAKQDLDTAEISRRTGLSQAGVIATLEACRSLVSVEERHEHR